MPCKQYSRCIALAGGLALIVFGFMTVKGAAAPPWPRRKGRAIGNAYLAGIITSAANPYFWIWWLSIGSALVLSGLQSGVDYGRPLHDRPLGCGLRMVHSWSRSAWIGDRSILSEKNYQTNPGNMRRLFGLLWHLFPERCLRTRWKHLNAGKMGGKPSQKFIFHSLLSIAPGPGLSRAGQGHRGLHHSRAHAHDGLFLNRGRHQAKQTAWRIYLKSSLLGLFLNYGLLSGLILLLSYNLQDEALRQGFIVMAAVPPAVAVLPMTRLLQGDALLSLCSEAVSYLASLVLMPAIIFALTSQTGISLSYLVQISLALILLPALASRAAARIPINPVLPINLGFFLVTYTVIGLNHGALWQGMRGRGGNRAGAHLCHRIGHIHCRHSGGPEQIKSDILYPSRLLQKSGAGGGRLSDALRTGGQAFRRLSLSWPRLPFSFSSLSVKPRYP